MGFLVLAKHGLNKHGIKDQKNWSHVGEEQTVKRGKERRREEEEEEKKRKRRSSKKKVWN